MAWLVPIVSALVLGGAEPPDRACLPTAGALYGVETPIWAAASCPEIFGDEAERKENERDRVDRLEAVETVGRFIDIVYDADWDNPTAITPLDVRLLTTELDGPCEPLAVLELVPQGGEAGCEPGLFAVGVDDSLGRFARVLAILDNILLIETDGELQYLSTDRAPGTEWRMVWHPPWRFPQSPGPARSSPQSRRPARRGR